jgi:hypothetical protein
MPELMSVTLSDLSQKPDLTLKELEEGDILVRRRDPNKEDVYLISESRRTTIIQALTALTAALDAIPVSRVRSVLRPVLQATYPWVGALSALERADFSNRYLDVVTKSLGTGELQEINVFLRQWQLHAETRSEEDLRALLAEPIVSDEFTGVEVTAPPESGLRQAVEAGSLPRALANSVIGARNRGVSAKGVVRTGRLAKKSDVRPRSGSRSAVRKTRSSST